MAIPGVMVCRLMPTSCRRIIAERFQLAEHRSGGRARDREPQTVAAAGLRHDERVDADDFPTDVDERAAGIPGIDRRVGLDVDERRIGIDLSCHSRDQPVRQAVAQPDRTAEREDCLALTNLRIGRQRQRRQLHVIDLQERQIQLGGDADDARRNDGGLPGQGRRQRAVRVPGGQHDLDPPGAAHDVGVRHDVAVGVDHEARTGRPLPADDEARLAPSCPRHADHNC